MPHGADLRRGRLERRHARRDPAARSRRTRERDSASSRRPARARATRCATGFAAAKHDVLMILDADLTVPPEDLPKFYRALVDGTGEFVNGSRLVYPMEPRGDALPQPAREQGLLAFCSGVIGQPIKDTLCGTKVLLTARLRPDRRRPRVLRRVRSVRRLRPAVRRGAAQPEDRRPAGALPRPHVRRDEHQPLAPRRAAAPDDGLRLLEVPGRPVPAPRRLTAGPRARGRSARRGARPRGRARRRARDRGRAARPLALVDVRGRGRDLHGGLAQPPARRAAPLPRPSGAAARAARRRRLRARRGGRPARRRRPARHASTSTG